MQKKLLSITTLIIAAGTTVPALAGFTISVGAQASQLNVETHATQTNSRATNNGIFSQATNNQDTSIGGELAMGYQYNATSVYNVALEAFGQVSAAETETFSILIPDAPTAKQPWAAGLRLRPGFYATPSTRLFIDGGAVVGGFELEQTDAALALAFADTGIQFDKEQVETLWGWRYGVGVEHKITNNFVMGVDYIVTEFDELKSSFDEDYAAAPGAVSIGPAAEHTPTMHTLGLNFKFISGSPKPKPQPQQRYYQMRDK